MRSFLAVTIPAASLKLLTIDEMRAAAGVSGTASDAALEALGLQVAASIVTECNIAVGDGAAPTLLQETLTETFYSVCADTLFLSRRHEVSLESLIIDGEAVPGTDYVVDSEAGEIVRLCDGLPSPWRARKSVVVYKAGFAAVPGDLRQAATDFFRLAWMEGKRDPALKSVETDVADVMRQKLDYWVGAVPGQSGEGAVPAIIAGQLNRFRNVWIA